MNKTCVVVADAGVARFYDVEVVNTPRARLALVEGPPLNNDTDLKSRGAAVTGRVRTETNTDRGAGPVHPIGEQRERHRGELDRRFGQEIVLRIGEITSGWPGGLVVLVAEPRLLGLVREPLRRTLNARIELKELAKDYTKLTAKELLERLGLEKMTAANRAR